MTSKSPCPNLNCPNFVIRSKELIIGICGGKMHMCEACQEQGYTAYNGRGDGMVIISHPNPDFCHEYKPKVKPCKDMDLF